MENINRFRVRLKELRKENNMTQRNLADKLGVVRTAIANYETGRTIPDSETLNHLATILNTTTDYLLGRTDNPSPISETEPSIDEEIAQIMKDLGPDVTLQFYDLKGMSDEEKEDLKLFLQLLKAKREKKDDSNRH